MVDEQVRKPGCLGSILWFVAALLATVAGGIVLGVTASGSEEAGMTATYVVAPPVLGLWAGAVVSLVMRFIGGRSRLVRIGAPFGCGCLTAVGALVLAVVFFTAIWPSL